MTKMRAKDTPAHGIAFHTPPQHGKVEKSMTTSHTLKGGQRPFDRHFSGKMIKKPGT